MIPCPSCRKPVSNTAESCPFCGHAFHRTAKRKYAVGCTLMVLLTFLMSVCFYQSTPQ